MREETNLEWLLKALDWAYNKAINGTGVIDSAFNIANDYLIRINDTEQAINTLINAQTAKCATSGFITGLGGFTTMPLAIPANVSSVLFMQLRMIAAIAIMRDFDPKCDQVIALAFSCLVGDAACTFLKGVGIRMGEKITENILDRITRQVISQLNRKVGLQLITKTSGRNLINVSKVLPIVGGIVGGAIDGSSTKLIGTTAKRIFTN
ncbi:MAG: EcsC family protein [Bacteroidota bacterium]|nr:EcsC family protein [Bacteroidota bacterium]